MISIINIYKLFILIRLDKEKGQKDDLYNDLS